MIPGYYTQVLSAANRYIPHTLSHRSSTLFNMTHANCSTPYRKYLPRRTYKNACIGSHSTTRLYNAVPISKLLQPAASHQPKAQASLFSQSLAPSMHLFRILLHFRSPPSSLTLYLPSSKRLIPQRDTPPNDSVCNSHTSYAGTSDIAH